jgi:hypothetical protein
MVTTHSSALSPTISTVAKGSGSLFNIDSSLFNRFAALLAILMRVLMRAYVLAEETKSIGIGKAERNQESQNGTGKGMEMPKEGHNSFTSIVV